MESIILPNNAPKIRKRTKMSEREIADIRLGNFDYKQSDGLKFIESITKKDLTRKCLVSLAHVFSNLSGIGIHRDYLRRKSLIFLWFDVHLEEIKPYKNFVNIF